jgi:leader peptidase (prepilin peptidase)/N-methyltransferase
MGFGDVLFIAMIGAFCGWKGVLFTILAASVIGTLFALIPRLLGKSEWSAKIPFGPYLAGGAAIWVFWGTEILQWYLTRTGWSMVDY